MLPNIVVATICWDERHRDVLHGMHSPSHILVISTSICTNDLS